MATVYDAVAAGVEALGLHRSSGLNWSGLCPAAALEAVPRTGGPELDLDEDRTIEGGSADGVVADARVRPRVGLRRR